MWSHGENKQMHVYNFPLRPRHAFIFLHTFLSEVKLWISLRGGAWGRWGGAGSRDTVIHSGMLNNLSFPSLLIGAKIQKKFKTDWFLSINSRKAPAPPDACVHASTYQRSRYFCLGLSASLSTLLCICGHGEQNPIAYGSTLNYSCHWAPKFMPPLIRWGKYETNWGCYLMTRRSRRF